MPLSRLWPWPPARPIPHLKKEDAVSVGIIQYAEHDALSSSRKGFLEALKDAGYVEGENLTVDFLNAQGDQANLQTMVDQLAGQNDLNFALSSSRSGLTQCWTLKRLQSLQQ